MGAEFNLNEYNTYILKINDDNTAQINDSAKIVVGSSGVVMRDFGNGLSSIIARAVVSHKQNGYATVRFELYSNLAQKPCPCLNSPQKVAIQSCLIFYTTAH